MKPLQRPVPRHRDLLLFGPLLAAAFGCAPAVPQEVVVPAIPVSTPSPHPPTPTPEAEPVPPPEVDIARPVREALREPLDEPVDLTDDIPLGIVGGVPGGVVGGVPGGGVVGGVVGGVPGGVAPGTTGLGGPEVVTPARVRTRVPCVFPEESDQDKVDSAKVVLRITVDAKGTASAVRVLADPGHGFGRAARLCAIGFKYDPARDASGAPMKSDTTLVIRFQR